MLRFCVGFCLVLERKLLFLRGLLKRLSRQIKMASTIYNKPAKKTNFRHLCLVEFPFVRQWLIAMRNPHFCIIRSEKKEFWSNIQSLAVTIIEFGNMINHGSIG